MRRLGAAKEAGYGFAYNPPYALGTLEAAGIAISMDGRGRFITRNPDCGFVGRVGGEAVTRHLTQRNGGLRLRLQSAPHELRWRRS